MYFYSTLSFFIWFSFLYRGFDCNPKTGQLTEAQERQLYYELELLSPQRQKQLFGDLERQRQEFQLSSSKWAKLRDTQDEGLLLPSHAQVDNISKTIRNGGSPVVRNKRTLKFLVKSLTEILGLRFTLLKYSLIPGVVNAVVGPAPAPVSPAPPAKPAPPQPPPKNPPPRPPPPPPPKAPPPAPPTAPAPPPPTIPQNQIDPNTIRYPFRPAPTIPFLSFAPLPPGVTVPYPPLFQWPSPAPPAMPAQPPCVPPPAGTQPKNPQPPPRPPSRLPLPKPRPPVPPPPPPIKPVLPASPGKTPLKLEYDHPVRIEIFKNVKTYLPASSNVYSGEPTLTSLEEKDENEQFHLNPTQAIQDIDDHYTNTENSENYNDDGSYGFLTNVPKYFADTTTHPQVADYDHVEKNRDYDEDDDHYENSQHFEETTPAARHNSFLDHDAFSDYPEQAEENRANVNIEIRHTKPKLRRLKKKKVLNPRKGKKKSSFYDSRRNIHSVFNHSSTSPAHWKTQSFPAYSTESYSTTQFPRNHAETWRNTPRRVLKRKPNIELTTTKNNFRIVVPDYLARKRRDASFDEAFKDFNFSSFDVVEKQVTPESTQAMFIESDGKIIPTSAFRKKLERDIEKYAEKYVEQQFSQGQIDLTKPKTTIIELKPKEGPPIKTVTTTLTKLIDEDKPILESILEYSKEINPVSNIAELSGIGEHEPPAQVHSQNLEVDQAFENFETPFSWNFSS